jgi:hypothetical protein
MDWDGGWGGVGWLGMGPMMGSIWVIPIALVVWHVLQGGRPALLVTAATFPGWPTTAWVGFSGLEY